jgi:hypothetical protein
MNTFYIYWMVHVRGTGSTNATLGTKQEAEQEASRLANLNPGKQVAVLEVVSAFQVQQPTAERLRVEHAPQPAPVTD